MSAIGQMRDMIETLMGSSVDDSASPKIRFTDESVCKSALLGSCPYEFLQGTRYDIGYCKRVHHLALKADFEKASRFRDYGYEFEALRHIKQFLSDCDHKIEENKKKLSENQQSLSVETEMQIEKIHQTGEELGKKLADAERLGQEGQVDKCLQLMEEVELLKKSKADAELKYRQINPHANSQQHKLRVCEVCSAYLGLHDNDRRLADHFGGKLHLGFIALREQVTELETRIAKKKEEKQSRRSRSRDRDHRRRDRSKSRDRRRKRSRDKSPDRNRSRERDRVRDRDRKRVESKKRDRSRSRDRKHDDRSRSKEQTSSNSREVKNTFQELGSSEDVSVIEKHPEKNSNETS